MTTRVRIKKAYLPKGWSDREYNANWVKDNIYKIGKTHFGKHALTIIPSPKDQPTTHFVRKISSVGKNEVIHCPTEREAEAICKLMDKEGWEWVFGGSYVKNDVWHIEESNTCYHPFSSTYSNIGYFRENNYTITPASEFLPTSFYDEQPKEHSITEETIPVLDNKYTAIGTYIENESPSARELFTWLLANEYI
jgi:hypothetical protein